MAGAGKKNRNKISLFIKTLSLGTQDSFNAAKKWQGSYFQIEICKQGQKLLSAKRATISISSTPSSVFT